MTDTTRPGGGRRGARASGRACGPAALHRPARRRARQGHPAPPLRRALRGGRRVLRRRDGHGPAPHAGRRRGGGLRRLRRPARPRHAARVPWLPEVAWCLGEAWTLDGAEHWPSARVRSCAGRRRATRSAGSRPSSRPSSSSSSSSASRRRTGGLRRYVDELSRVYTVGAVSDPREVVLRMLLWCDELGLEAFAANHEFMNSQYEINVKHSGALDAADRAFMLKAAVKEIAAREGLLATFMGRPFADQGGSGFHLHLSLQGGRAQRVRRRGRAGRAEPARRALHRGHDRACAGAPGAPRPDGQRVQAASSRTASRRPTRTGATTTAPRSAACRKERGSRARVEVRTGDGSACAHLITAALLLAGLDGIERGLEPPEPVVGDAYRMDDAHAGTRLPPDLGAALDALEADTWLVERLGPAARRDVRRDEAVRGRAVRRGRRRARPGGRLRVGGRGVCGPPLRSRARVRVEVDGEPRWGRRDGRRDRARRRLGARGGGGALPRARGADEDLRRPPDLSLAHRGVRAPGHRPSRRTS